LDNVKTDLAIAYYFQLKYDESEKMLRSVVDGSATNSTETAATIRASYVLGIIFLRRNRLDEADQFCRRALLGQRRLFGKSHSLYRQTTRLAIEICKARGEHELAEAFEAHLPPGNKIAPHPPLKCVDGPGLGDATAPSSSGPITWKRGRNPVS
jgi:hypothetical protein